MNNTMTNAATACTMSTVAETDRFTIQEIQTLWDDINNTSKKVVEGLWSLHKIIEDLESRLKIKVGKVFSGKVSTVGDAKRRAKSAFSLACALMISAIETTCKFTDDEIYQIWNKANYKYDSIHRGYINLIELCETLEDEYGITVGGVLVNKEENDAEN